MRTRTRSTGRHAASYADLTGDRGELADPLGGERGRGDAAPQRRREAPMDSEGRLDPEEREALRGAGRDLVGLVAALGA